MCSRLLLLKGSRQKYLNYVVEYDEFKIQQKYYEKCQIIFIRIEKTISLFDFLVIFTKNVAICFTFLN